MRKLDVEFLKNVDWTSKDIDVNSIYEDKKVYDHFAYLYNEYIKEHHQDYIQYFWKDLGYRHIQSCKLSRLRLVAEILDIDDPIQEANGVPKCPICGIHFKDMQAHVKKSHDLDWNVFVERYDYKYLPVYFSKDHCD